MRNLMLKRAVLLVAIVGVAGCKKRSPAATPPRDAAPAIALADAAPAPVDAVPAPVDAAEEVPQTVDQILALPKDGPPVALGGVALGAPPPAGDDRFIPLTGCGADSSGASVTWRVGDDGKVRHVVLEIECAGTTAAAVAARAVGWPKATQLGGRTAWRGPASVLTVADYDGFLRGTPSLVIDLVPATGFVACTPGDGSAELLADLRRHLAAGDAAAVAAAMTYPVELRDAADGDLAIETADELIARFDAVLPKAVRTSFGKQRNATCNLSQEVYWWVAGEWHFEIARAGTTWKANGPRWMTHDTDLDPASP